MPATANTPLISPVPEVIVDHFTRSFNKAHSFPRLSRTLNNSTDFFSSWMLENGFKLGCLEYPHFKSLVDALRRAGYRIEEAFSSLSSFERLKIQWEIGKSIAREAPLPSAVSERELRDWRRISPRLPDLMNTNIEFSRQIRAGRFRKHIIERHDRLNTITLQADTAFSSLVDSTGFVMRDWGADLIFFVKCEDVDNPAPIIFEVLGQPTSGSNENRLNAVSCRRVPESFLDSFTDRVMDDPCSIGFPPNGDGQITEVFFDRATLDRFKMSPYSRVDLSSCSIVPQPQLRADINAFVAAKEAHSVPNYRLLEERRDFSADFDNESVTSSFDEGFDEPSVPLPIQAVFPG